MFDTFRKHKENALRVMGMSDTLLSKQRELNEAQMQLQKSQSLLDYETAMVRYNVNRIKRLKEQIQAEEDDNRRVILAQRQETAAGVLSPEIPTYGKVDAFPVGVP